jgi:hypothetical protein
MTTEGMVDALRRAHRTVDPFGTVVDLHPSAVPAILEVGGRATGIVCSEDGPLRHAAAGVALAAAVQEGLFAIERSFVFRFYTYSESVEELSLYVSTHWRSGCIDADALARTRAAMSTDVSATLRVCEQVYVTKLRVLNP